MNPCRSEWGLHLLVDTYEGSTRFWRSLFDAETSPNNQTKVFIKITQHLIVIEENLATHLLVLSVVRPAGSGGQSSSARWQTPLMLVLQVAGLAPTIKAWSAHGAMLPLPAWLDPTRTTVFVGWCLLQPSFICTASMERAQAHLDPSRSAKNINRSSCCSSCLCTQSVQRRQRFQLSFSSHNNKYRKLKLIHHLVD